MKERRRPMNGLPGKQQFAPGRTAGLPWNRTASAYAALAKGIFLRNHGVANSGAMERIADAAATACSALDLSASSVFAVLTAT